MYVSKSLLMLTLLGFLMITTDLSAQDRVGKYQLAEPISDVGLKAWNISVYPDGKNLPEGRGSYAQGKVLYEEQCMACHGENGQGGIKLDPYRGAIAKLVKNKQDSLTSDQPQKSIGTYWQYAPSLFDYIRRTMPYQAPKSLSDDEVYVVTAYLLAENGIIERSMVLTKNNLAKVKMPNVNGFLCDNKIDTKSKPCMKNCHLPRDKNYQWLKLDSKDNLQSDCLVAPVLVFESK